MGSGVKPIFDKEFLLNEIHLTDDEQRRRAALKVCNLAGNADDAKPVLLALGLIGQEIKK